MKISVVTGASSGMGRDFVKMLDKIENCEEIWVIARRADRLAEIKSETGKKIVPIELDLSLEESYERYEKMLKAADADVVALVNAAGFGKFGDFEGIPLREQMNMIDLNCKALMAITYITLAHMNRGARVYQLGSLSSFQPVPYINVYAATKAFVLSFSRGLNRELRSLGIKVMAVCPFWTKTEFFGRAIEDDKEKVVKKYIAMYTPDQIVTRAIKDLKKGRDFSICGFKAKGQTLLVKLLPHKLVMNVWMKQQSLR